MFSRLSWVLFFVLIGSSCNPQVSSVNDPKRRLNEYISQSFSVRDLSDRDKLVSYLTGESKTRLAAWSEEQFRQAFIDSKRQFIKLIFSEIKTVSPTETSITYELSYLDQAKGQDAKVINKKLCQMVLKDNQWFIAEVKSIKELIEYRNEMSLP